MRSITVQLQISVNEFQRLYEGSAQDVTARCTEGRRVRFPAHILRPFVTYSGIYGTFAIHFDDDNRFKSIEKID